MTTESATRDALHALQQATDAAQQGDYESAVVLLKSLLADHPGHPIATGMLGAIYLQIGMHQKASRAFRRLLDDDPANPLARFQLGMTRMAQGLPGEAVDTWQPLLDADGEFMANFHSALALLQLRQPDRARPLLEKAGVHMPVEHPLYPELARLLAETGAPA